MALEHITSSESATFQLGKSFCEQLEPGQVVALFGEVGSGKTMFIKGVCEGLRVKRPATSPTFIIMNEYEGLLRAEKIKVRHFDFYRIEKESDLNELGLSEFIGAPGSVTLIEWAEHMEKFLPENYWKIRLDKISDNERKINLEWHAS